MYSCCRCNQLAVYGTFCAICYHPHCLHCLNVNNDIAEVAMDLLSTMPTLVLPAPAYFQETDTAAGMHVCPGCETRAVFRDLCAKCEGQQTKTKLLDILWKTVSEFEHMKRLEASLRIQMADFARWQIPITPARSTFDDRWVGARFAQGTLSDPFVTPKHVTDTPTTETDGTRRQSDSAVADTTTDTFTTPEAETDDTRRQSDDDWEEIQTGLEETRGRFQTAVSALANEDVYWTDPSGDVIIP